jgi:protocatechuate 3,4-dioxygenase beta subunit
MKIQRHLDLGLAVFLTLGQMAEADTATTFRLKGTVQDASGSPLPDAVVEHQILEAGPGSLPGLTSTTAARETQAQVNTGPDGTFELALSQGLTVVLVRKPGFAPAWKQFWNLKADVEEQFVLTPPSTLGGTVVDENEQPVKGAEVFASMALIETSMGGGRQTVSVISGPPARQLFSTRTAADGRFLIGDFPTNAVADLAVEAPGKALRRSETDRSISLRSLPGRAGRLDLRLLVEPAGHIEGRIVTTEDSTAPPAARVWVEAQQHWISFRREPVETAADGTFRIPDLAAGSYGLRAAFGTNAFPDWVAEGVQISVESGRTTSEATIHATPGGVLKILTQSGDDREPLSGVMISVNRPEYQASALSDESGAARLRLPPGSYQIIGTKGGSQSEEQHTLVELNQTNRIAILIEPPPTITGIVLDPDGRPIPGLEVRLFGGYLGSDASKATTDAEGRFSLSWNPRQFRGMDATFSLIAQEITRNLSIAHEIDEHTRTLDLRLEPGLRLAGRVESLDGAPLPGASVSLFLWTGNMGSSFGERILTDAEGNFEMATLPADRRYSVSATAQGYGSASRQVEGEPDDLNRIDLEPLVLRVADQKLAGQVLDPQDNPVEGAQVHLHGEGQPSLSTRTDHEGRFAFDAVCEGMVRLFVSAQNSYAHGSAEAGDMNVVLYMGAYDHDRPAPQRRLLTDQPLPDLQLAGLGPDMVPGDQPLLLCLFDYEQRPSRRGLQLLADQHELLTQKGIVVAALQVAATDTEAVEQWRKGNPLPFPVGLIDESSAWSEWASGVEFLPWLILRDAQGKVLGNGFGIDELDLNLKLVND